MTLEEFLKCRQGKSIQKQVYVARKMIQQQLEKAQVYVDLGKYAYLTVDDNGKIVKIVKRTTTPEAPLPENEHGK